MTLSETIMDPDCICTEKTPSDHMHREFFFCHHHIPLLLISRPIDSESVTCPGKDGT